MLQPPCNSQKHKKKKITLIVNRNKLKAIENNKTKSWQASFQTHIHTHTLSIHFELKSKKKKTPLTTLRWYYIGMLGYVCV